MTVSRLKQALSLICGASYSVTACEPPSDTAEGPIPISEIAAEFCRMKEKKRLIRGVLTFGGGFHGGAWFAPIEGTQPVNRENWSDYSRVDSWHDSFFDPSGMIASQLNEFAPLELKLFDGMGTVTFGTVDGRCPYLRNPDSNLLYQIHAVRDPELLEKADLSQ